MTHPTFNEEEILWQKGINFVAGVDEVGRGAFAGPLVAAAVILPKKFKINGINDSKLLTPKHRETLSEYIKSFAVSFYISEISVDYINKFGVGIANQKAFLECVKNIKQKTDFVLVDGFEIDAYDKKLQKAIIKGDQKSISIAAASILAKVYRDNLMTNVDKTFPQYGFAKHKGYGTKMHQEAIQRHGLCIQHRTSFNLSRFFTI